MCVYVCECVLACLTQEFKDSLLCAASGCSCLYPSGVYLRSPSTHSLTHTHTNTHTYTHTHMLRCTHTSLTLCSETPHPQFYDNKKTTLSGASNSMCQHARAYTHTHTYTQCPEARSMSCNPASHPAGLITLLPACDPRERLSHVSRPLPFAGGHGDGSARPFITVTLGRETRGMGCVGELE